MTPCRGPELALSMVTVLPADVGLACLNECGGRVGDNEFACVATDVCGRATDCAHWQAVLAATRRLTSHAARSLGYNRAHRQSVRHARGCVSRIAANEFRTPPDKRCKKSACDPQNSLETAAIPERNGIKLKSKHFHRKQRWRTWCSVA